jgi:hypothetical protein
MKILLIDPPYERLMGIKTTFLNVYMRTDSMIIRRKKRPWAK